MPFMDGRWLERKQFNTVLPMLVDKDEPLLGWTSQKY